MGGPRNRVDVPAGGPHEGTYRGHAGVSKSWNPSRTLSRTITEIEECIPAGEDVLLTVHAYGRGKTSGVEVNLRAWHIWTLRGGKAVRWRSSTPGEKRSKLSVCRSKTLTPTPEPAGYCAGDVAGERGDRAASGRGFQPPGCLGNGGGARSRCRMASGDADIPRRGSDRLPRTRGPPRDDAGLLRGIR